MWHTALVSSQSSPISISPLPHVAPVMHCASAPHCPASPLASQTVPVGKYDAVPVKVKHPEPSDFFSHRTWHGGSPQLKLGGPNSALMYSVHVSVQTPSTHWPATPSVVLHGVEEGSMLPCAS